MRSLFEYNWMVRKEWYDWCRKLPEEELLRPRTGGMGSILKTFWHIIDVEWSWLQLLQGKPDDQEDFQRFRNLDQVMELDRVYHREVAAFLDQWEPEMESRMLEMGSSAGMAETATWGEVMRHVIVHEIHHIGQLSVWARELEMQPVSANFIGRGLGNIR